jgi:hypothetical protein
MTDKKPKHGPTGEREGYAPMHPRRRLQRIIDETQQLIWDIESWCDNRPDQPPIDCEADRVVLSIAKKAAAQWDAGDIDAAQATMAHLSSEAAHG